MLLTYYIYSGTTPLNGQETHAAHIYIQWNHTPQWTEKSVVIKKVSLIQGELLLHWDTE